jgi:hypothetical protein
MQNHIPAIYFAGHAGPFTVYPGAAYAIRLATRRDKIEMPKWRNNIMVAQVPTVPDDNAVATVVTAAAQNGSLILPFADHGTFKAWQRKLSEVLA